MGRTNTSERDIRRANVFRLFVAGKSYRAIADELAIDKDTVTDDVRALTGRLDTWATQQKKRALATVVATYQRVIDEAWAGYDEECTREKDWLGGVYDREHDAPDADGGMHKEKKAPPFKVIKVAWLNTIRDTATAFAKVAGVAAPEKLEVTGKDGDALKVNIYLPENGRDRRNG